MTLSTSFILRMRRVRKARSAGKRNLAESHTFDTVRFGDTVDWSLRGEAPACLSLSMTQRSTAIAMPQRMLGPYEQSRYTHNHGVRCVFCLMPHTLPLAQYCQLKLALASYRKLIKLPLPKVAHYKFYEHKVELYDRNLDESLPPKNILPLIGLLPRNANSWYLWSDAEFLIPCPVKSYHYTAHFRRLTADFFSVWAFLFNNLPLTMFFFFRRLKLFQSVSIILLN